jgi:hypothetical protein
LKVRLPLTVVVPIEPPGENVPPALIVVVGSVPVPPTVAPAFTVRPLDLLIEPFTSSVPPLTVVGPVYVSMPPSVVTTVPVCVSAPVPEMTPLSASVPVRLIASVPLFTTSPTIEPVAPPLPSCSVPPLMVVPPV